MTSRLLSLAVLGLLASLAACGGSQPTATPTERVSPTAAVTPTDVASESASSSGEPSPASEPLDLVIVASSGGYGVAQPYAALAAEALDREVRVQEDIVAGVGADALLSRIQSAWADDVAQAEIIVFNVSPSGLEPASHLPCVDLGKMFMETPVPTSVEDWQEYRDALDRVYDEIWRLRAGQPTIIRVIGTYMPLLPRVRQAGIASGCMADAEVIDQVERDAAEAAGAVFVSWLDLFYGPAHDGDPVEQGWFAADNFHPSPAGVAVLVEALAAVKWELSQPPR